MKPSLRKLLLACLAASIPGVLPACATYPERTEQARSDFLGGQFAAAEQAFADPERVESPFLLGVEAGTCALTAGDWAGAMAHLHGAVQAAAEVEGRALAGSESLGETLASWTLNDGARAYQGEGFERVYLHCALAMTYLARGMLDDVFVEVQLANRLLEAEETLYEASYGAGGWGHLLSAVTYEILGEPDQAYVDYERMADKGVGAAVAGPALLRLAARLGRDEDLERWRASSGSDAAPDGDDLEGRAGPEEWASIVVLAGIGLGPVKEESRLILPIHDGVLVVSGARFRERPQRVTGLRLWAGDRYAETQLVEDVGRVAAENLDDRQAWLLTRSSVRGVIKHEVTQILHEEYGPLGFLAGALFAILTERADLRCWTTLPDTWQAVRLFVPPGVHGLTVEALGGEAVDLGRFELEPGETMLLFARTLGTTIYPHPIGGLPMPALEEGTP